MILKSLHQSLMYEFSIRKHQSGSLLGLAVAEMASSGQDSWLSRVRSVQTLLDIPVYPTHHSETFVSAQINLKLKSHFDSFYLEEINKIKLGDDNLDHNKLRFYKTFKGCFKTEPYIFLINNRNQRKWISRLRTSSHRLEIETGRYTCTPVNERQCEFCSPDPDNPQANLGTEAHFLINCVTFSDERRCLFQRLSLIMPNFPALSEEWKVTTLLCPVNVKVAKLLNKYIGLVFKLRDTISEKRKTTETQSNK